jgi:hypothetical protein
MNIPNSRDHTEVTNGRIRRTRRSDVELVNGSVDERNRILMEIIVHVTSVMILKGIKETLKCDIVIHPM